jgi:hypothetical protein
LGLGVFTKVKWKSRKRNQKQTMKIQKLNTIKKKKKGKKKLALLGGS